VNDRSGGNAVNKTTGSRRRRPSLLVGAAAVAATASLATVVFLQAAAPSGTTPVSRLAASVQQVGYKGDPTPAPTDSGKGKGTPTPSPTDSGKGKGTPTPSPTDSGKGKGTPTPTPTDSGKGKGTPTPSPTDSGKGKGTPTPSPTDSGKGKRTPTPSPTGKGTPTGPQTATLAAARQLVGFSVRTLDGLDGARLESVSVSTVTFDTAPGQPSRPMVELRYAVGQMQVSIVEVQDPLDAPPAAQTFAEELSVGGSRYALSPRSGPVNFADTRESDGVSIVVNFFARSATGAPAGADRQTAYQIVRQLG
jgi:hypothetical protein